MKLIDRHLVSGSQLSVLRHVTEFFRDSSILDERITRTERRRILVGSSRLRLRSIHGSSVRTFHRPLRSSLTVGVAGLIMHSTTGSGSTSLRFVSRLPSDLDRPPSTSPMSFRTMRYRSPSVSPPFYPSRVEADVVSQDDGILTSRSQFGWRTTKAISDEVGRITQAGNQ